MRLKTLSQAWEGACRGSVGLYLVNIGDQLGQGVEPYLRRFPEERQRAILRYRSSADRNRTLWAELLARWLIAERTGQAEVSIERDERGKPYSPSMRGVEFSISHSGPWVACSLGGAVNGVDVETDRGLSLDLAKHFFPEREYLTLKELSEHDPMGWRAAFLRCWTLKESYAKCTGRGLADVLRNVEREALLRGEAGIGGRNFDDGGAVLGVCAAPDLLPDRITRVRLRTGSGEFSFECC